MSSWDKVLNKSTSVKTSVLSTSEAREFQKKAKKLESLDDSTRSAYKDAKLLKDALDGLAKCEQKLVADLYSSTAVQNDQDIKSHLRDWMQSEQQLEENATSLANLIQKIMIDPLKRFRNIFPDIQATIKKREQCLLEYSKWYLKVDKYQSKERSGANVVKLATYRKNLATAKEDFDSQNFILMQALPELYEERIPYLEPSIKALMSLQIHDCSECHKMYTELHHSMTPVSQQLQQERFNEIKNLSIVSPD